MNKYWKEMEEYAKYLRTKSKQELEKNRKNLECEINSCLASNEQKFLRDNMDIKKVAELVALLATMVDD